MRLGRGRPGQDDGGHAGGSGGDGHAHEEARVHLTHLDIEARQTQGAAGDEEEGGSPPDGAEAVIRDSQGEESIAVGQDCRCHAEAEHIRQGIELNAELGGGVGRPGDPTVQSVEDAGKDQENGGPEEVPLGVFPGSVEGHHHAREPAQDGDHGDDGGKGKLGPPHGPPATITAFFGCKALSHALSFLSFGVEREREWRDASRPVEEGAFQ